MKVITASAFLLFSVAGANAAESYSSAGVATGTATNTVHAIGEGHMIIQTMSSYDSLALDDPENPMSGLTGPCFGAVEIVGNTASGSGNCAFSGDEGDMMSVRWIVSGLSEKGALLGQWAVTGGAGKFAGASGGGSFHSLTDQESGAFENTLKGAISIP